MINEKVLLEFDKRDKYGNVFSFRYIRTENRPVERPVWSDYQSVMLKVNYRNKPKQIRCPINSAFVIERMTKLESSTNSFTFSNPSDINSGRHMNFIESGLMIQDLTYDSLLEIDREVVNFVFDKMMEKENDISTSKFIAYYKLYSCNVFELIDKKFRQTVTEYYERKFPSFFNYTNKSLDLYKISEFVNEIDSYTDSNKMRKEFEQLTLYSFQLISNINYSRSGDENVKFFSKHLKGVDFCIPTPTSIDQGGLCAFSPVVLHEFSSICYFPFYILEAKFQLIYDRLIKEFPFMEQSLKSFESSVFSPVIE